MIKIAIIGYGNIGRAVENAVQASPDMVLTGIYHHNDNLTKIDADVAILCVPTREVPTYAHDTPFKVLTISVKRSSLFLSFGSAGVRRTK